MVHGGFLANRDHNWDHIGTKCPDTPGLGATTGLIDKLVSKNISIEAGPHPPGIFLGPAGLEKEMN